MRTGTKFWLAIGVGVVFPLVIFFALLLSGKFTFDGVTIGVFLGAPVAVFTAFGILNVKAQSIGAAYESTPEPTTAPPKASQ